MGIVERAEAQWARDQERVRRFDSPRSSPPEASETLRVTRASDIKPEPIHWLWKGWLARGKFHVLAGVPGTGKTTLALALATAVTTGRHWPDRTRAPPGNVVVWSGEDDPKDTLVPRLLAMGADLDRVFFVGNVSGEDGERSFDPARDVPLLEQRLERIGDVCMVVVDPVVNAVAGDSHKNGEVRRALAPLVDLAQRYDAAVLGISHFSKGTSGREPLERVTGSLAFGALARVVLVAAKAKADDDGAGTQRLLARAKSNIGPDDGGHTYEIAFGPLNGFAGVETSWVVWGDPVDGSARDLLAEMEPDATTEGSAVSDAEDFLRDLLMKGGPRLQKDVKKVAVAEGFGWATVRRAKTRLDVRSVKDGMSGGWRWELPPEGAQRVPKVLNTQGGAPSVNDEHLRPLSPADDGWDPIA